MVHEYRVDGMTCAACQQKVRDTLAEIEGLSKVEVDLDRGFARIHMDYHISTEKMNAALKRAGGYSIQELGQNNDSSSSESIDAETASFSYKPLVLVLGFILLLTLIAEYNQGRFDWMRFMKNYMGGFFVAFSFFKILDVKGFAYSYMTYDIITKRWLPWGFIYPFVELVLGIALLTSFQLKWTLIAVIIIMGLSSIGVIRAVVDQQKIQCACLGTGFNLPMSTVTIIEDVGMMIMAVVMLIAL